MLRPTLLLVFTCVSLLGRPACATDDVDRLMATSMARLHIPGAAVAVLRDGKVVKLAAYGQADLESGQAVTPHSAFQLASSTKLFTGTLLMELVHEGRIALDKPVSAYLDDLPEAWHGITVRQLASHTSGLPRTPADPSIESLAAGLQAAKAHALAATPGTVAAYGSDDFPVLAAIIEKAGGAPLQEQFRRRFFAPLGMRDSRWDNATMSADRLIVESDLVPRRVTTYELGAGIQHPYRFFYPSYTYAAGGLFGSITDVAAFLRAFETGRLLAERDKATLWTPYRLADGTDASFAVGWTVSRFRGERMVGHAGGPALADIAVFPERHLAVAVLTNQRHLLPTLARDVAALYLPPPGFADDPGVSDTAPAQTRTLRTAIAQFTRGRADPALFSGDAKASLEEMNTWLPLQLGGLPPLRRLVPLAPRDGQRRYRAVFGGDRTLLWVARFDDRGRIAAFDIEDE